MLSVFVIVFIFFTILFIINVKDKNVTNFIFIICGLILILIAGLRDKGLDNDYEVYHDFWATNNIQGTVEYSFYIIKVIIKSKLGLNFQYFLLAYAFLGVCMKLIAIKKLSPFLWGSLLIYFSHYFILHEFTQIRIGVATGFLLLSIFYLAEKKYWLYSFFAFLAIFFHQTCIIVLIFPFITNNKSTLWVFCLLIPFGYVLYFLNTYLSISIPIPGLQDKVELYEQATKSGFLKDSKINAFNAVFLFRIIIFYMVFFYTKRLSVYFPKIYIFLKIYALSLFSFLFLSKIPVFAFRIQELLGVVEIIIIPLIIFIFPSRFRWLGKISVVVTALILFMIDVFYNEYILK